MAFFMYVKKELAIKGPNVDYQSYFDTTVLMFVVRNQQKVFRLYLPTRKEDDIFQNLLNFTIIVHITNFVFDISE